MGLSHVDGQGHAAMVDVSAKAITERIATARGVVVMSPVAFDLVKTNAIEKGDVLAVARIAGTMAAKKTAELIPLCHPLPIDGIVVDAVLESAESGVVVTATVKVTGRTGVEMEALTAVSVACLTIYDMVKAVDRSMEIRSIQLIAKSGGRSGAYHRESPVEGGSR